MTQRLNAFFERAEARWSRLSLRRRAWIAAALLTAAVAILTGALFGMFALRGSSILFRDDDFAQHYPFLIAIGRWWRAFFADPLRAPLFDFSLGFGEDFIGGLNYYGLGDPLTVLAALFAPERTYVCYRLLAALRIELAGLAFLAFCREHRVRWRGALPGAAAYAFTVYMVAWCALKHPMFANPCIHLPLMLLGAERRLKGKSPAALIFAAAWSALCGFYFLYMNSLMLLLYALARHFALNGRDALRRLPGAFGRTLAAYLLGVGMAGAFLLPAALSFLESCRNGMAAGESLLWYSPSTYWAFPISFIASNGWSNAMTVPAAAMLAVLALFASGRENRGLKLAAAAVMLALLIPAVGVVFNGFSYPTDRWKYGGLLLLCYVFARFSGAVEKGARGRLACGLLLIWCVVLAIRWKRFGEAVPHPLLIALAAALCVLTFIEIALARRLHRGLESAPALKRALSAGLLVLFVGVNILADMLPIGVSLLLDNGATKDPWTRMQECSLAIVSEASSAEKASNAPVTAATQPSTGRRGTGDGSVKRVCHRGADPDQRSGAGDGSGERARHRGADPDRRRGTGDGRVKRAPHRGADPGGRRGAGDGGGERARHRGGADPGGRCGTSDGGGELARHRGAALDRRRGFGDGGSERARCRSLAVYRPRRPHGGGDDRLHRAVRIRRGLYGHVRQHPSGGDLGLHARAGAEHRCDGQPHAGFGQPRGAGGHMGRAGADPPGAGALARALRL